MQKEGEDHAGGYGRRHMRIMDSDLCVQLHQAQCNTDSGVYPHFHCRSNHSDHHHHHSGHHCQHYHHLHTCDHLELLSENELLVSLMVSIWIFQTDEQIILY